MTASIADHTCTRVNMDPCYYEASTTRTRNGIPRMETASLFSADFDRIDVLMVLYQLRVNHVLYTKISDQ